MGWKDYLTFKRSKSVKQHTPNPNSSYNRGLFENNVAKQDKVDDEVDDEVDGEVNYLDDTSDSLPPNLLEDKKCKMDYEECKQNNEGNCNTKYEECKQKSKKYEEEFESNYDPLKDLKEEDEEEDEEEVIDLYENLRLNKKEKDEKKAKKQDEDFYRQLEVNSINEDKDKIKNLIKKYDELKKKIEELKNELNNKYLKSYPDLRLKFIELETVEKELKKKCIEENKKLPKKYKELQEELQEEELQEEKLKIIRRNETIDKELSKFFENNKKNPKKVGILDFFNVKEYENLILEIKKMNENTNKKLSPLEQDTQDTQMIKSKKELFDLNSLLYDAYRLMEINKSTIPLIEKFKALNKEINLEIKTKLHDKKSEIDALIDKINETSISLDSNKDRYDKAVMLYNKYKDSKWYNRLNPFNRRQGGTRKRRKTTKRVKTIRGGKWSNKYKKSINCKKPKGFSQKQYCKFKKRR
jgi:hypothetical protein